MLGKSYGEIAAESRSQHKSQGFGVPSSRGSQLEYFKTIKGDAPQNDLMDGVTTNWERVNGGAFQSALTEVIKSYSFQQPQNSVPALLKIYNDLKKSGEGYWRDEKLKEMELVIKECMGLYLEATTNSMYAVQGDSLRVNLSFDNRVGNTVSISSVKIRDNEFALSNQLPVNENVNQSVSVLIPGNAKISQPYWLEEAMTKGSYVVKDQVSIGKPSNDPESAQITVNISGTPIIYSIPIQYKTNDPVKGEEFQPLFIIPKVELKSCLRWLYQSTMCR